MDQLAVVNDQIEGGRRLIAELGARGFEVAVGFWAKPSEEGGWSLYLASPYVDRNGELAAYLLIHRLLREGPDLSIDPMDIQALREDDSLAEAALALIDPKRPGSPYAWKDPACFPRMISFGGSSLGGLALDAAYFYPPRSAATA